MGLRFQLFQLSSLLVASVIGMNCGGGSSATEVPVSSGSSGAQSGNSSSGSSVSGSSVAGNSTGSGTTGAGGPLSGNTTSGSTSGDTGNVDSGPSGLAEGGGSDDATTGGDGPISSGNCGTRTGMRGKTTRTLMVGGKSRTYVAYLPSGSATTAMPFVYVFHGATQTGADMVIITQYTALADSKGIAVVFPDGQGTSSVTSTGALNPWNVSDNKAAVCGAGNLVNNANEVDFDFMDAIKADMTQDQCLDASHTFATGFSMGGYFTHHIACDRTDIRAVGPASGGTLASLSTCKTGHVPMIIFHGTSDPLIAPGCDDPNSSAQSGFTPSATLWAAKNGCKATYTTIMEPGTTSGDTGQCYLYDGCPSDGQVELCTFTKMPHAWAGAAMCPGCIGSGAGYADATKLEWDFFTKYAW